MKRIVLVIFALLMTGCMKSSWVAKYYMVKAENSYERAHEIRAKKELNEKRKKLYHDACKYFAKAYQFDPKLFTLNRLYSASDACLRVGDSEEARQFRKIEEEYVRTHPKEAEYGEAGFMIGLE